MDRPKRRFRRFLVIALLFLLTPIFVFGATVAATGTITVRVAEPGGTNLYVPVPALLFDLAAFAIPMIVPQDAMDDVRREIAPYRETLEALADELANCPPGVLVEVKDGDEYVTVSKSWRNFEIEVDSPDADIRVSIPARLLGRSLDIIG